MMNIILRGLRLSCLIGMEANERHLRQTVLVDADLTLADVPADDGSPTLNYATAVAQVREVAAKSEFRLLETFADAVAARLVLLPVVRVRVCCYKPKVFSDVATVGVELVRDVVAGDGVAKKSAGKTSAGKATKPATKSAAAKPAAKKSARK